MHQKPSERHKAFFRRPFLRLLLLRPSERASLLFAYTVLQ
ncbi:hypothetical protein HMPREF9120_02308 [Neisseria sp. oral taxon 020 str. F0370]|nr:hypothetical protein HMPREF9120_02308 [Neisseria sp. oral taxon 020 str. F0370]